jgi:drug/metabolite transporter (DMT)-like permease
MMSISIKIITVYTGACLIWGSTWLAIKAGLSSLTPMFGVGLRFALAAIFVYAIMRFRHIKLQIDRQAVNLYITMAFLSFVIPFSLVYWAEQYVPSGLAAVLFAIFPFFTALFSYFIFKNEKIGAYKISGMILGFAGIAVIFSDSFSGSLSAYALGICALIFSAFLQAFNLVILKKFAYDLNPLSMNLIPMLITGLILIPAGLIFEDTTKLKFDGAAVISVTYLAFFGSVVAFTSYYWLLKRLNVVILSLITFITPIIALFLGWIFYSEQLSPVDLLGCFLVLAGLIVANLNNLKKLKKEKIIQEQPV